MSAALAAGCGKQEAPPAPPPVEVTVLNIEPRDTPIVYEYVAQTQSPQEVNIVARVSGFLEKQAYTEGEIVKKGQLLFQMDQKPFIASVNEAQAGWDKAKAAHDTSLANLNRVKPLAAQNALSKKDLDDAIGSEQASAASLAAAKANLDTANLNLSYTTISSPLNGVSGAAQQKVGAYLSATNSQLTTVSALNPMWVNFSVSENEISAFRDQIAKGLIIPPPGRNFAVEIVLVDGTVFPQTGKITFADPSFNPQTGTFLLRATFANPKGELRPNQYVRARLNGALRPKAILVPQAAVQQGSKGHFVWVVGKDGKAENRPVVPGDWFGDQWFINAGLIAGEQVVVGGALKLYAGAAVKAAPYEAKPPAGAKGETPAAKPPAEQAAKEAAPDAAKK
ncbi:MAG TPA: efflux RND transporter periplasmic adaptor subunit [Burkholderiales bacterium]|nr:efflux RND transporter periplasmic adaptor subunit [Burkholderiales bacterium]